MSIVNVVRVGSFEELVPYLSTCSGMVICDDDSVIAELRSEFASLYVKQYSDIRIGQFPNATYILRVEDNTDVNTLRSSLGANAVLYTLPIEKVTEDEEVENDVSAEEQATNEQKLIILEEEVSCVIDEERFEKSDEEGVSYGEGKGVSDEDSKESIEDSKEELKIKEETEYEDKIHEDEIERRGYEQVCEGEPEWQAQVCATEGEDQAGTEAEECLTSDSSEDIDVSESNEDDSAEVNSEAENGSKDEVGSKEVSSVLNQDLLVNLEEMLTKDYSMFGEGIVFDQANFEPTPVKPYDDQDFTSMSAMFAVLTGDMNIVASKDILARLAKERPDIRAREIHKGGIATTGGMVVLLSVSSRIHKREARRIYPSDATLFTVSR